MTATQQSGTAGGDSEPVLPPPNSFAGIVLSIYNDLFANALHEVVQEAHRTEKLLRTQQVQLVAAAEAKVTSSGLSQQDTNKRLSEPKPIVQNPNPMMILPKEIICSKCKLPRHSLETLAHSTGAKEDKKKYCSKLPYQTRPLHDIYGNPSPTVSVSAKEKKAKAAALQAAQAAAEGITNGEAAIEDTLSCGEGTATIAISIPNGRKTDAVVYFKCTNCSTEKIAAARFAAHLEKCLGLAGRKSSRAAMAKMSGGGSGSGVGSGAGSPAMGIDSVVGAVGNKGSGKSTPDAGEEEMQGKKKEKGNSFIVSEDGINVPPPPAPVAGASKVPGAITKKKKKPGKDNTVLGGEESKDAVSIVKDHEAQATGTLVPTLSNSTAAAKEQKDLNVPVKKRKRKAEAMATSDDSTAPSIMKVEPITIATSTESIILARSTTKPPVKKQKIEGQIDGSPVLKKSQISKFKDRDSPGPVLKKGGDIKRDSSLSASGGKFSPGRNATPPPNTLAAASSASKPSSPVIPTQHLPSTPPKPSPAKLASIAKTKKSTVTGVDGVPRKVKSSQGGASVSAGGTNYAGTITPKIPKKTLPGVTSNVGNGVNVPPPPSTSKVGRKTLPPKTPVPGTAISAGLGMAALKEKNDKDSSGNGSPEKMRKTMSNGAGKTGTPKPKIPKQTSGAGAIGVRNWGKTLSGKTVSGQRAVPVGNGGVGHTGRGGGETDGGVPRKRPKVGD